MFVFDMSKFFICFLPEIFQKVKYPHLPAGQGGGGYCRTRPL
jgi:hypothetical protein